MAAEVRWLWCLLLVILQIVSIFCDIPHKRFEYKFSFKPPYLAQKDGSVPFWEYGGNAIASEENVRITPSLRSQKGAIWTKLPTNFDWWEIEIVFRVSGRGRVGADGLAFWYTDENGGYDGNVFGSKDQWRGLGVFFDSFDNDNKHNNPYIMAVVNDGTKVFDHQNDGTTQQLAGCLRDFRNKPFPTRAKIEYYKNTLTVLFHNGMTNNEQDFEMCLRAENIFLPKSGHFGLSAATGGLADDHDVLKFLTQSLHPPDLQHPQGQGKVTEEEQQRLSHEYQEYQRKLDQQKEEYQREHPDAKPHGQNDAEGLDWFESDQTRELKMILSTQQDMYKTLRDLNNKLDEIVGRQERTLSLVGNIGAGVPVQQPVGGHGQPPLQLPQPVDSIRRHEVDAMLSNQRELVGAARDIKAFVTEIHQKSSSILQNQAKAPTATVQSMGYDVHALINEMKEGLNVVKRDVNIAAQRAGQQGACPTPTCLSTTIFLIFAVIQLVITLAYLMYRDSREAQAKKFY